MYIAIDLILAAVMLSTVIVAWKRGFIRSVFRLCTTVASVVIAVLFYRELGSYFCQAFLLEMTEEYVGGFLTSLVGTSETLVDPEAIASALPQQLFGTADLLGLDISELLDGLLANSPALSTDAICTEISVSIAAVIANILAFAALFFGSLILLRLVSLLLDKVAKLPILKGVNKFLGLLLGIAEALVLGVVLSGVTAALLHAYGALHEDFLFTDIAGNTYIAAFLLRFFPW